MFSRWFKKIIVTLARHELIINNVVGDGADENRSAMKSLGTLSIEDVLEYHLTDNLRKLLPLDMKVTFPQKLRNNNIYYLLFINYYLLFIIYYLLFIIILQRY